VTAVRTCPTRARPTALASTTTSSTGDRPGSANRPGALDATKTAQTSAVAGGRAPLARTLAADRAAAGQGDVVRWTHERGAPVSGTENSPTGTLEERLRIGAGFAAADRPRILGALSALAPHLSGWEHDQVDLELSLKDTEGPDQKVTLQAWLAGRTHLVATSHERDLDQALAEVRRDLIRQIEDDRSRREPRKRRKTRYRTS
jgi:ribosome-associated translation inhibitor RaiA